MRFWIPRTDIGELLRGPFSTKQVIDVGVDLSGRDLLDTRWRNWPSMPSATAWPPS